MNPLIVFYSHSGNNEKLALELKERLECDIHKIREVKKRKKISILFDWMLKRKSKLSNSNSIFIKEYDIIIFVAPIWAGKIASPMRAFIEREKSKIKNYSYISLCNGEIGQEGKIHTELFSILQINPNEVKELKINNLLPKDKQHKIKHTFNFEISTSDLKFFDGDIESFIKKIKSCGDVKQSNN